MQAPTDPYPEDLSHDPDADAETVSLGDASASIASARSGGAAAAPAGRPLPVPVPALSARSRPPLAGTFSALSPARRAASATGPGRAGAPSFGPLSEGTPLSGTGGENDWRRLQQLAGPAVGTTTARPPLSGGASALATTARPPFAGVGVGANGTGARIGPFHALRMMDESTGSFDYGFDEMERALVEELSRGGGGGGADGSSARGGEEFGGSSVGRESSLTGPGTPQGGFSVGNGAAMSDSAVDALSDRGLPGPIGPGPDDASAVAGVLARGGSGAHGRGESSSSWSGGQSRSFSSEMRIYQRINRSGRGLQVPTVATSDRRGSGDGGGDISLHMSLGDKPSYAGSPSLRRPSLHDVALATLQDSAPPMMLASSLTSDGDDAARRRSNLVGAPPPSHFRVRPNSAQQLHMGSVAGVDEAALKHRGPLSGKGQQGIIFGARFGRLARGACAALAALSALALIIVGIAMPDSGPVTAAKSAAHAAEIAFMVVMSGKDALPPTAATTVGVAKKSGEGKLRDLGQMHTPPLETYSEAQDPNQPGIYVPPHTSSLYADVSEPPNKQDMPVFWHLPFSGSGFVKDIAGQCLRGILQFGDNASDGRVSSEGTRKLNASNLGNEALAIADIPDNDAHQIEKKSIPLGLNLVNMITSPTFNIMSESLSENERFSMFTLMQHPVNSVVSGYHHLSLINEKTRQMNMLEFAHTTKDNWVVRFFTSEPQEPLTMRHLEVAKEIMRRKVLVGIEDQPEDSMVRFERYFGWWDAVARDPDVLRCQKERLISAVGQNQHQEVQPGSQEFRTIATINWADVQLYHYARELFQEQGSLI